jgi:hypothetical protein
MQDRANELNWEVRYFYPSWEGALLFYPYEIKNSIVKEAFETNEDMYFLSETGNDIVKIRHEAIDIKQNSKTEYPYQSFGNKQIIDFPIDFTQLVNSNDQLLLLKALNHAPHTVKNLKDLYELCHEKITLEKIKKIRHIYFTHNGIRLEFSTIKIKEHYFVSYCFEGKVFAELQAAVMIFDDYCYTHLTSEVRDHQLTLGYVDFIRWIKHHGNL